MTEVLVRWITRRDIPEAALIESQLFPHDGWSAEEFTAILGQRNCIGMVADHFGVIVGYVFYDLNKGHLHIINLAVHPAFQGQAIGRQMIDKLKAKIGRSELRNELLACVRESNVGAQLFFRQMGFRAVKVIRDGFADPTEDSYRFRYVKPVRVQRESR